MKSKKRRPKGMLPKKLPMYLNGGMMGDEQPIEGLDVRDLIQYLNEYDMGEGSEIPTYGGDPDMITNQQRALSDEEETMARLSLGITPPEMSEDILRAGDSPFRTITQEKDRIAEQRATEAAPEMAFEAARMSPGGGELIDAAEFMKVAMTGEDFYGEEQDPALFGGMTAAGYLIPNILEKPMKSAWRAIKKFPSKMPKQEFRKLPGEQREAVLQNLTQAHNEVYDMSPDRNDLDQMVIYPEGVSRNIRQLPSLMSGSKLENTVGKDGLIQVSQIENLINSKDLSVVEREALQEVMGTEAFQTLREMGGGSKVDYNKFRNLTSNQRSVHNNIYVDTDDDLAELGLDKLGYQDRYTGSYLEAVGGSAQVKVLQHNTTDLMSNERGHFGKDVIGHYRTFDLPDEPGVLYISEVQADPLQARGPKGNKKVSLNVKEALTDRDVKDKLEAAKSARAAAQLALQDISEGRNPKRMLKLLNSPRQVQWDINPKTGMTLRQAYVFPRDIQEATGRTPAFSKLSSEQILESVQGYNTEKSDVTERYLSSAVEEYNDYIKALEGGYRGGPNPKQANLIKNQDQFLISHILEQEAKGADKLRFPTGETTSKIQGYGDVQRNVRGAERDLAAEQGALDGLMVERDMFGNSVPTRLANRVEGMGLKNRDHGETLDYLGRVRASRTRARSRDLVSDPVIQYNKIAVEKFDNDALKLAYKEFKDQAAAAGQKLNVDAPGFKEAVQTKATSIKTDIHTYSTYIERIKSQKEHISDIKTANESTQGIMKGYDRLPKALKKHGLDATKVTDDVGNTWWEVDIPARLGEGVGEIRAYNKGGKFRILKK